MGCAATQVDAICAVDHWYRCQRRLHVVRPNSRRAAAAFYAWCGIRAAAYDVSIAADVAVAAAERLFGFYAAAGFGETPAGAAAIARAPRTPAQTAVSK